MPSIPTSSSSDFGRRWRVHLPWLLLLLAPILLFPEAWFRDGVISADDHLSVQPAFQDVAGGTVRHPHLSDPALQFAALRRMVVEELSAGRMPLWNPDIYGGAPLLGDGQSMVGSPVTWLRLFFAEDLAQNLGVTWILMWTGLGTALLLRRLGVSRWPAVIGGAAAMTGPFVHVWLLHPQAATFCWIPWLLWAIEGRLPVRVALCFLGLIWGGHPGTAVHGALLAFGWWGIRSRCRWSLAGLVVGAILSLPLMLPLLEQALRSTTVAARGGSVLLPVQLLDLVWPGWLGHPALETWSQAGASWADGQLHPGPVTLLLALFALGGQGKRLGRWIWVVWFVFVLVSLVGLPGPFNHARLASLGALLLAIGAGLGAARVESMGAVAMAAIFSMTLFSGGQVRDADQGVLPAEVHDPTPASWTRQLASEMGCEVETSCGRVLGLGWWLQPNTGSLAGLRDLRGYDLPVSEDTHRLMTALSSPPQGPWYPVDNLPSLHLLRFAAVEMVLSGEEEEFGSAFEEASLGTAPLRAWRLSGALPRAWATGRAQSIDNPDVALAAISTADLRAEPPVEGLNQALSGEAALRALDVDEPGNSERRLSVDVSEPSLVVLSEAWAPGWRATVNGEQGAVLRVGGAFMGVLVPTGSSHVVFRYRPLGWVWGRRFGIVGVLLLLGLSVAGYRHKV